ncbi:MAG: precorrin-2 C(20)-methyltransferase [Thermodesulfovibrionales bacterium]
MKKGRLSVIGVGPGDPELLTLKAVRILNDAACVIVPKGREEGSSLARSIVEKAVDLRGKDVIEAYFPMRKTRGGPSADLDAKWNETVETVLERLDRGDAAFITIGDPTIYSTFRYLHDRLLELRPGLVIELVPGVSSITASAAAAGVYLGIADERIAVLPANYTADLERTVREFDTVVLMKVNKVFREILSRLEGMKLAENAVYVARAGMPDEKIVRGLRKVKDEELNYFSLVIVKK